jgi:hypothetical protein
MGSRYGDHSDRYKPDLPAFEWRAGHTPYLFIFPIFLQGIDEEIFHFLARPRCLAEKLEAGFDRGIIIEAANFHAFTEAFPAIEFLQADHDLLKGHTVERVVDLFLGHLRSTMSVAIAGCCVD